MTTTELTVAQEIIAIMENTSTLADVHVPSGAVHEAVKVLGDNWWQNDTAGVATHQDIVDDLDTVIAELTRIRRVVAARHNITD